MEQSNTTKMVLGIVAVLALAAIGSQMTQSGGEPAPAPTAAPDTVVAPKTYSLRLAVTDERTGARRANPLIWTRAGGAWYPDLSAEADVRNVSGFAPGVDTILVFGRGRDMPPVRIPLVITDSICTTACVRDMTMIVLRNAEFEVTGAAVVGKQVVGPMAPRNAQPPGVQISRDSISDWPLSVASGWLDCVDGNQIVFRTRTRSYAVNGTAASAGYTEIEPIWTPNPDIPGARLNIQPLLERGQHVCQAIEY